jgi:acyl-CoA thioesterase
MGARAINTASSTRRRPCTTGFGQAELYRGGKQVLRATAAFTDLDEAAARDERSHAGGQPPDQPPPEQCEVLSRVMVPPMTLVDRIEYRVAEQPSWVTGTPPSELWDSAGSLVAQSRQLALVLG